MASGKLVLNPEVVYSRYELGLDFFEEYLQYFDQHAKKTIKDLGPLLANGDFPQISRVAHDLKGLCFNLGLEKFATHLTGIEDLTKQEDGVLISQKVSQLAELSREALLALHAYRDAQES